MLRRSILLYVSLAAASLAPAGAAAPGAPEPSIAAAVAMVQPAPLSADEAVAMALARNAAIVALRQDKTVEEARIAQAGLLPNPEVKFGTTDLSDELSSADSKRRNVGLRWSPPRIGETGLKTKIARSHALETAGTVAVAEQRLAAEVRVLHRTICLIDEQIRAAEEGVRIRERILDAVKEQVRAGVKTELDRSLAELALSDSRSLPERYRGERRVQIAYLANKIGAANPESLALRSGGGILDFTPPSYPREKLIARALANRAELNAADHRCTQAGLNLKAVQKERYPWFSSVELFRRFKSGESGQWGFQLVVDMPVFSWGKGYTKVAGAEVDRCGVQKQAVKAGVVAEVDEVLARLRSSADQIAAHQRDSALSAERHIAVARAQLAAGQADLLEPLVAQAQQLKVRQDYIARLMEFRALEVGLDQAVGEAVR